MLLLGTFAIDLNFFDNTTNLSHHIYGIRVIVFS